LYTPEVQWDRLAEAYNPVEIQRGWREKVLNLTNPGVLLDGESTGPLVCNWVTSYDIQMARKGDDDRVDPRTVFQLASGSVMVTKDNYVVVGPRGTPPGAKITPARIDQFAATMFGNPAGGSAVYSKEYKIDPITDTVFDEFGEEVGNFNITDYKFLCVFEAFKPGPTGYKFATLLETDAKLHQLQEVNREAREKFWTLIGKGASLSEAKQELKKKRLPPDAWEHDGFVGIPNRKESLEAVIGSMPNMFPGICSGALMIYAGTLLR